MLGNKIYKKEEGVTLIELLVAMSIFLIALTAAVQIFMIGMSGVQRLFGRQDALDSARYILESMSKEIRMSDVVTSDGNPISMLHIKNSKLSPEDIYYTFSGTNITRQAGGGTVYTLNPSGVQIIKGYFIIAGNSAFTQPRVTIVLSIKSKTGKSAEQVQVNLQTTVSSRQYAP